MKQREVVKRTSRLPSGDTWIKYSKCLENQTYYFFYINWTWYCEKRLFLNNKRPRNSIEKYNQILTFIYTLINGRSYSKNNLVLAAKILSVFPTAYRVPRTFEVMLLPRGKIFVTLWARQVQKQKESLGSFFDEVKT